MSTVKTTNFIAELFDQHGLECVIDNDWVFPNGDLPAVRATWFPGELSGLLSVETFVREGVLIEECFAGMGQGGEGIKDGLMNFIRNSFHVLLAALFGKNDHDQVSTENWNIGDKKYTAYIGNFGTRASEGVAPHIPEGLFDSIEATIKRESLTNDIHWFRLFFCNLANEFTFEALKDNEIWEAGTRCLEATDWRRDDGYYSVRLFLVLCAPV